jgi:hypothetical protein
MGSIGCAETAVTTIIRCLKSQKHAGLKGRILQNSGRTVWCYGYVMDITAASVYWRFPPSLPVTDNTAGVFVA